MGKLQTTAQEVAVIKYFKQRMHIYVCSLVSMPSPRRANGRTLLN